MICSLYALSLVFTNTIILIIISILCGYIFFNIGLLILEPKNTLLLLDLTDLLEENPMKKIKKIEPKLTDIFLSLCLYSSFVILFFLCILIWLLFEINIIIFILQ
jgi:hypothetical protein